MILLSKSGHKERAELASQICSGAQNNDNIEKLAEGVKEWMIKRVEDEIKGSGL